MNTLEDILAGLSHLNLEGCIVRKQQVASKFGGSCDLHAAWSERHRFKVAVKRMRIFMRKDDSFAKVS